MARPADKADDERLRRFGQRVRDRRLAAGLSQEQLAHEAGLDRTYVGGVERGERNITVRNLYRLADALGVSPVEFFQDERP